MAVMALIPAAAGLAQSMLASYGSKAKPAKPSYKKYVTDPSQLQGTDYKGLRDAMMMKLSQQAGEGMRQGQMNLEGAGVRGADVAANVRGVQSKIAEGQGAIEADIMSRINESKLAEMDRLNQAISEENRQLAADYGLEYQDYGQDRAQRAAQFNQGIGTMGEGLGSYFSEYEKAGRKKRAY